MWCRPATTRGRKGGGLCSEGKLSRGDSIREEFHSARACLYLSLSLSLDRECGPFTASEQVRERPISPHHLPPPWGTPPRGLFRKATSRFQVFDTPRTPYQPSHILSRLLTLSQPLKLVHHPAHLRILLPVLFPFLLVIVIVIVLSILPLPLPLPLLQHPNPILE